MGKPESLEERVRKLEAELEQKRRDMEVLTRVHSQLHQRTRMFERIHALFDTPADIELNLEKVLDILMEEMDVEAGSVMLIDGPTRSFWFAAARGPAADKLMKIRFPVDKGIAGACARERKPIAVSDVASEPRFFREVSDQIGYPVSSLLAVPMRDGPGVLGVVEVLNKRKSPDFSKDEVDAAMRVADLSSKLVAVGLELREKAAAAEAAAERPRKR